MGIGAGMCCCDACACGYVMPAGKQFKVNIGSLGLANAVCSCCDEIEGPFYLRRNSDCTACCMRAICQGTGGSDPFPYTASYVQYTLAWISKEEGVCYLNVVFGMGEFSALTSGFLPNTCNEYSLMNFVGRGTKYRVVLTGPLVGPWTLTKTALDELTDGRNYGLVASDAYGPHPPCDEVPQIAAQCSEPEDGRDVPAPCGPGETPMPETIVVSLEDDEEECDRLEDYISPEIPGDYCAAGPPPPPTTCTEGICNGTDPPAAIVIDINMTACCHVPTGATAVPITLGYYSGISGGPATVECCHIYFAPLGCVSEDPEEANYDCLTGFGPACYVYGAICYNDETDETYFQAGFVVIDGSTVAVISTFSSATISGRIDCEDFEQALGGACGPITLSSL